MEKPVKNSKNLSPFLLEKLESLLLAQKPEEALSFLKRYSLKNIKKWVDTHLDEWIESGKYDLIEVFLKTGTPDLKELLKTGFIKRNDELTLLLVKQGALKCMRPTFFLCTMLFLF